MWPFRKRGPREIVIGKGQVLVGVTIKNGRVGLVIIPMDQAGMVGVPLPDLNHRARPCDTVLWIDGPTTGLREALTSAEYLVDELKGAR